MTGEKAAFHGTYSDLKFIKTRKVCQVTIELPIEAGTAFVAAFGTPDPSITRWVAIALLDAGPGAFQESINEFVPENAGHGRRAFCDLPFPQQAALKSNDEAFVAWLRKKYNMPKSSGAELIRIACDCDSRADILPSTYHGERWLSLLREYEKR